MILKETPLAMEGQFILLQEYLRLELILTSKI